MKRHDLTHARIARAARSTRVHDVLDAWELDARCRLGWHPQTISHCRAAILQLAAGARTTNLAAITVDDVLAWMARQPSSKTMANKRCSASAVFSYAAMRGLISENPIGHIKWRPPAPSRPIGRPLTKDQVTAIVAAARSGARDRRSTGENRARIYLFLWATALRTGETSRQLWRDVDLSERTLRVTAGKVDRGDVIGLPDWLIAEMMRWPRDGARVFPTFMSRKSVLKDFTAAGITGPGKLHRFRSGAATYLRKCGLDLIDIAKLTRHADLNTLRKSYIEFDNPQLAEAQRLMAI